MKHISIWLVALTLLVAPQARAAPTNAGHVQLELVPAAASIAPGQSLYVALHEKIRPGWHTYWRNPGDAGEPPKLGWTLPAGWKTGDIVWPAPKRLPVGPLMDYGYEDEVWLPIPVTAPKSAAPGRPATLKAAISILVCKDVCVPEDATLQLDLPVAKAPLSASEAEIAAALAAAPHGPPLKGALALKAGVIKLAVASPSLQGPSVRDAYFYPYSSIAIDQPKPQTVERGRAGLTLTLQPGAAFKASPPPASLDGLLVADGHPFEVHATPGPLPAAAAGLGPATPTKTGFAGGEGVIALAMAAGAAFLGGIVLNLMPCVFPILSMKALALASHASETRRARLHGLAFLSGVLLTFVALAAVLIAAKTAGGAVGWGFQLQSPGVVAALALVMLLIGLNLSGLFEAGLMLQNAASGAHSQGLMGSVLTGALAVVVAAPCTAPFMAGAIAYALTRPEAEALIVFAALGLGFAAPFTLVALAPRLLGLLPRPGAWMEALKKALAFPMYGAAAWLLYVLTLQAGTTAMAALLAAAVILALAAWLYGAAQRAQLGGKRPFAVYGLSALALAAAIACAVGGVEAGAAPATAAATSASLPEQPYSPDRLAALRAEGRPVFVDFTAAWCITCQVNERTSLTTSEVLSAFKRTNAVYLKADWTRRDASIAEALAEHGRAGVPLYLVYGKDGGEAQVLPQILTSGAVVAALDKAAGA
jgi:thiol:disulfide interchange protein DsbD